MSGDIAGRAAARIEVADGSPVFVTVKLGVVTIKQGSDLIRLPYDAARELAEDIGSCLADAIAMRVTP